jgi:hypothetical protein
MFYMIFIIIITITITITISAHALSRQNLRNAHVRVLCATLTVWCMRLMASSDKYVIHTSI